MDTDSFIFHVKSKNIYKDIAEDVETRFDTSNFEIHRPLPKRKNEKEWKIQQWWTWKAKGTKQCVIKRKLRFQDYKKV